MLQVDKLCAGGTFCKSLGIYPEEGEPSRFARHGVTV